jgi:hypothetical protein
MAECKYYKQVRQVSYDNGVTWISLDEFQKGDLYENDSPDCGGGITQYKWVNVSGEYTCVRTTKYQKTKKQQSTDGGQTWVDVNPPEYSTGAVIERESSDCGGGSEYENQYLTLVAKGNGNIKLASATTTYQYSTNGGSSWTNATSSTTISVRNGDRVMFKGTLTSNIYYGGGVFSASTQFEAEGNPMSLLYGDDFVGRTNLSDKSFASLGLFSGCTNLTSIENLALPATTLGYYCYHDMFYGCASLTSVPSGLLPATTLATSCYGSMFENCTSLTSIPSDLLPATTLAKQCYRHMFQGCTSLTNVPRLPATTLADNCYVSMFQKCTSLTSVPSDLLPATTLADGCYQVMFDNCSNLATLPQLPATALTYVCYSHMFRGCAITSIPNGYLPATTLADGCYETMFTNCASLTSVPSGLLPATTLATECYRGMFTRCTSLRTAPELPATTLTDKCYFTMFNGCTRLNYVKCLATNISATQCTYEWLDGVSSSGTFVKSSSMSGWSSGVSGIPTNWTVQNA